MLCMLLHWCQDTSQHNKNKTNMQVINISLVLKDHLAFFSVMWGDLRCFYYIYENLELHLKKSWLANWLIEQIHEILLGTTSNNFDPNLFKHLLSLEFELNQIIWPHLEQTQWSTCIMEDLLYGLKQLRLLFEDLTVVQLSGCCVQRKATLRAASVLEFDRVVESISPFHLRVEVPTLNNVHA